MKDSTTSLNKMIKGGLILTISSFIAKLLSAVYKVPFQNLTGNAGFYVYQQIYPIYGLAVGLTLTGLPAFVSKIVSEAKDEEALVKSMRELNTWFITIGLSVFFMLQLSANQIASLMGDSELTGLIQAVSFFFLFLPFLSLVRGYFQGQANMVPTSVSQVAEQLIRVIILVGVALSFVNSSWTIYEMGTLAYSSSWLSAIASSFVLVYYLKKERKLKAYGSTLKPAWSGIMGKRLVTEGVLLLATSSIMVLFQFIDSFTIFNALKEVRYTNEIAMTLKGVYDRGQPLVQLGLVVGLGFTTTSLPVLRKWVLMDRPDEWQKHAASLIRITTLLSGAATIGLMAIMPSINYTLFADRKGTTTLQTYVISVFLVSLIYCMHTILQSKKSKDYSIYALVIGLVFKAIMNKLAVRAVGITGASMVTVFSLLIICVFMMLMIEREVWKKAFQHHFILKIVVVSFAMFLSVSGIIIVFGDLLSASSRLGNLFLTLLGVMVGVIVYVLGIYYLKVLTKEEMSQLPLPKGLKQSRRK